MSNRRSTAIEATAAVKRTRGSARESAKARTNSPGLNGMTLLDIIPIAVDCQSGRNGRRPATGARRARHRRARSGKIAVPNTMHPTHSGRLDFESTSHTALTLVPFMVHQSSSALRSTPSAARTPFFILCYSASASSSRS